MPNGGAKPTAVDAGSPGSAEEPPTKKPKTEAGGGEGEPAVVAAGGDVVIRIPLDDPVTLLQLSQIERGCVILTLRYPNPFR